MCIPRVIVCGVLRAETDLTGASSRMGTALLTPSPAPSLGHSGWLNTMQSSRNGSGARAVPKGEDVEN